MTSRRVTVQDVDDEDSMQGISYESLQATSFTPEHVAASRAHPQQAALLAQLDRKKRARLIAVPTDDARVRAVLKEYGEPITLFGEGPGDRRDRLREILSLRLEAGEKVDLLGGAEGEEGEEEEEGEFYTPGSQELLESRRQIARFSLAKAKKRLARQRVESTIPLAAHLRYRKALSQHLATYQPLLSELGGSRAISSVRFSPDAQYLASANWSGLITLFSVPSLQRIREFNGHQSMAGGISWVDKISSSYKMENVDSDTVDFISGGGDGAINLWSVSNLVPLHTLQPHTQRIFRTAIHPSDDYFAATSFDDTWSLTSLTTQQTILHQPGHSADLMGLGWHPDGGLVVTGGRDAVGRVWDVRSGRTVMVLDGHGGDLIAAEWSPEGVCCVTGAVDGMLRVWDLRSVRIKSSIPAHTNGVSDIKFFKPELGTSEARGEVQYQETTGEVTPRQEGTWLATSGFDGRVNLWSGGDWVLQKGLVGHGGKCMSVDVSRGGRWLSSGGWDRSVRLYGGGDDAAEGEDGNDQMENQNGDIVKEEDSLKMELDG